MDELNGKQAVVAEPLMLPDLPTEDYIAHLEA